MTSTLRQVRVPCGPLSRVQIARDGGSLISTWGPRMERCAVKRGGRGSPRRKASHRISSSASISSVYMGQL